MRRVIIAMLGALMVLTMAVPVLAAPKAGFGNLFYEDGTVRTVVPPAASPQEGVDDFYGVTNGLEGQLGVAAVAPGDQDYHGGKWAFHAVTWKMGVTPYLLTSAQAVLDAAEDGHVTIDRVPEMDFKCPIQPGGRHLN
jgi:hypothetical protein